MMKNLNKFWMEQSGNIYSGAVAVAITLAMLSLRYVKYFLL